MRRCIAAFLCGGAALFCRRVVLVFRAKRKRLRRNRKRRCIAALQMSQKSPTAFAAGQFVSSHKVADGFITSAALRRMESTPWEEAAHRQPVRALRLRLASRPVPHNLARPHRLAQPHSMDRTSICNTATSDAASSVWAATSISSDSSNLPPESVRLSERGSHPPTRTASFSS